MPPQTVFAPEAQLRDQRTMVGHRTHATVEEVELAWREWAETYGFAIRRRFGDFTTDLKHSRKHVAAYISGGSWTADCPNCNGGVPTWPGGNARGCCLDCGTIYPIDYPPAAEIVRASEALLARPPVNRHWFPQRGESAKELLVENKAHGLGSVPLELP